MEAYRSWILIALVLFVAQSDLRQYRISNRSVLVTLASGLAWNLYFHASGGLAQACLGVLVGFALLIPLYAMGGMTAGDVKWLAALGAWYGPKGTLGLFLVSGLALGVVSLFWIAVHHKDNTNSEQSHNPVSPESSSAKGVDAVFDSSKKRQKLIPYAFPVALGVLIIESIKMIASRL